MIERTFTSEDVREELGITSDRWYELEPILVTRGHIRNVSAVGRATTIEYEIGGIEDENRIYRRRINDDTSSVRLHDC